MLFALCCGLAAQQYTNPIIDADYSDPDVIRVGDDFYLAVVKTATGIRVIRVTCLDAAKNAPEKEEGALTLPSPSVYLRVRVTDDANCEFSFSRDGKKFQSIGEGFKAKPVMWIGAKVGLFALGRIGAQSLRQADRGHADYVWFRIEPLARSAQTGARVQ